MEWKLIELKWVAMARRMRADAPIAATIEGRITSRSRMSDAGCGSAMDDVAAPGTAKRQKDSSVSTP